MAEVEQQARSQVPQRTLAFPQLSPQVHLAQMPAMALVPARPPGIQRVVALPRLANLAQKLVLAQRAQPGIFRQVGQAASLLRVLAQSLWAQPLLRLSRRAAMRADHP